MLGQVTGLGQIHVNMGESNIFPTALIVLILTLNAFVRNKKQKMVDNRNIDFLFFFLKYLDK